MKKALLIAVDAGYGHQRAAYPLKDLAYQRMINANNDNMISSRDREMWNKIRSFYERVSRMTDLPLIGNFFFGIYDRLQEISPFFPFRDLSKPTVSVLTIKKQLTKNNFCSSLLDFISNFRLPVATTHFIPALACDYNNVKNRIYCIVTDSDVNRVWVSDNPKKSRIIYLSPCRHVVRRLREYGVPEERIILTGFPLPKENIGSREAEIVRADIGRRLPNLDPKKEYIRRYKRHIKSILGKSNYHDKSTRPLTITYLVGGAGAQKEIGIKIAKGLKEKILKNKIRLNLVAGIRLEISNYFNEKLKSIGLGSRIGKNIKVLFTFEKQDYFKEVNALLKDTDIIWTKPSEMCFYTALGLPVIITPPVGAHEKFNQEWLEHIGSGFKQENPDYVADWLYYWLESGRFAEAALEGFIEAPTMGAYYIEDVVLRRAKRNISRQDARIF